ncbi:MAG: type II CRISPR RNA-guided endonuclease Cas9 [Prevotellaceae bacterium]|jgi:CRISPR subtype II RNA-guided endonuclease Cas9/Csn1|nr:type II CRISPR RNA-guided endonuclease Cas9 [Prevotellaceae bacterium]
MEKILGLDLGTNSIGWAIIEVDDSNKPIRIIAMGSRIIPMGTDKQDYEKGVGITKNATRREKRTARKMNKRYKLRRNKLLFILHTLGMLPDQFQFKELNEYDKNGKRLRLVGSEENTFYNEKNKGIPIPIKLEELELLPIKKGTLQPDSLAFCQMKVDALTNPIELKDLGKILYNLNQLRGYSGGNNDDDKKKKKADDENDDETKKKSYEVLVQKVEIIKVEKSEDTFTVKDGKNKGEKQNKYDVTINFNDKEVEGQTELQNLKEKEGGEEELEIRISRKKDDSVTYKFALPQKSNWRKNMEAAEKILKEETLFISQLRLRDLQQSKWTRVRNRVFLRSRYKEEFDKIWDAQAKHYSILNDCPKETLEKIANYIFPGTSESQKKLRDTAINYEKNFDDKQWYEQLVAKNPKRQDEDDKTYIARLKANNSGLKYLIKQQIIYYQRPLKPQTELIGNCRFEKEEKTIPTSHPLFQEFRCWKQINNLYIASKGELTPIGYQTDLFGNKTAIYDSISKKTKTKYQYQNRYLTDDEKQAIFEKLLSQKEVGFGAVIDILNQTKTEKLDKKQKDYFLNGLNVKAKLKGCDTLISIKKNLGEYYDLFLSKDKNFVEKLWEVIYDTKNHDGSEYEPTSKRVSSISVELQKYSDEETSIKLALKLAQNIKFPRKYASLSVKAIQNILPLMRLNPQNISEQIQIKFESIKHLIDTGEIIDNMDYNLEDYVVDFVKDNPNILEKGGIMEAFAISLVYGKHTAEMIKAQIANYHDIKYEERNLRNPIVEQLANETMQVIKAIWKEYKFNPSELEIRVELARDLKNSAEEREKIWEGQRKNKKINDKVKERLQEDNIALTDENILKFRLYEQQKFRSPYTNKEIIPFAALFDKRQYDIDHIIPKSRYYDDSFSNKVICEAHINEEKSNRTAWEYIAQQNSKYKNEDGTLAIRSVEDYVQHINENFYGKKKKNLLAEKIPTNPVERQLKDTQYISVAVKNELAKIVGSENVKTSTGEVTDFLRSRWGLKKLFMELTENRFRQMELWDLDENGNPKTKWIKKEVIDDGEKKKNIYEIKNWSKRYDHRHHAIDALVVALTQQSHIQRLNNLNKYVQDELTKRKDEYKIEQKEDETILDAFFNLEANRRDEILRTMESSRKFEAPFPDLVKQAREHLETMVISHKPKDKLGIKVDDKTQKKQLKIRAALHEETYYGKLNSRDTKRVEISTLSITKNKTTKKEEIVVLIDKVLESEIIIHRNLLDENGKELFQSMKEAFTGEGVKIFNDKRVANGKQPVYKVKIWYNKKEKKESGLQRLYDSNEKRSVITGDNYLFIVMLKKLKDVTERVFTVASLYDSVAISNKLLKDNDSDFKRKIVSEKRLELKYQIIKEFEQEQLELKEKIIKERGKKREESKRKLQENQDDFDYFIDESGELKLIPLFTLQQNELVYFPTNNDPIPSFSADEFAKWIELNENKKKLSERIYKVVKIDNPGLCHFIPHNYANHISVAKDLTKDELEQLKVQNESKKKIPKKDLNFVEFSSYGNCSPYEVGQIFINYLKNGSKVKPLRIQDTCIKIQTDWLGNIKLL